MTVSADTLALLMNAGISGEQLLAVVRSIESDNPAAAERPVSGSALRMRRLRERRAAAGTSESVTSDVTCDANSDGESDAAPALDKRNPQTPKKINPTPCVDTPAREAEPEVPVLARLNAAQVAIAVVLAGLHKRRWKTMPPPAGVSAVQWQGFLDHRKALRKSLTDRAYQLLCAKLADHDDPEWPPGRIVDHMTEHVWLSFKPEWLPRGSDQRNGQRNRQDRTGGARRFRDPLLQSDFEAGRIDPPLG